MMEGMKECRKEGRHEGRKVICGHHLDPVSESESEWSHVLKKHSLEGRDSEPDHTGPRLALGCESPHLLCYYGIIENFINPS